jgi:arsenite methyltransferase
MEVPMSTTREAVHDHYRAAALRMAGQPGSGASECCDRTFEERMCGTGYAAEQLAEVGLDPSISLGCGNPVLLAELRPGEVVLDLGSGGGLDVLLSARRVAPGGRAYGVDMTDEMLDLANRNRERAGVENAIFLKGTIDRIPLPARSIDVVISNCVVNLTEDKDSVVREAYRVLKPGGRLAVTDTIELRPLPPLPTQDLQAHAGCIAGTIPVHEYRQLLIDAGFESPDIEITGEQNVQGVAAAIGSAAIRARKPALR